MELKLGKKSEVKNFITILLLIFTNLCFAQKKDYKFLIIDQYDGKWFYSFDKKTSDGFYSWLKVEESLEKNPSTKSTEYYIEFKCANQSMSDQIVIINWRKDKPEFYKNNFPFKPIPPKHPARSILKEYCK